MTPPPPPPPPSPSRANPPLSATSTPDALDKAASSGDAAVFAGLDAFNSAPPSAAPPTFAHPAAPDVHDDDGMQNMILELSRSAEDPRFASTDQDWTFDTGLNVPYFYNTDTEPANYSALPMHFMDTAPHPSAPVPAPPPPTPQLPLTQQLNMHSHTLTDVEQIHISLRGHSEGRVAGPSVDPNRESDVELSDDKSPHRQQEAKSAPAFIPGSWPGRPTNASRELAHAAGGTASPLVLGRSLGSPGAQLRRANSARMRSPGSSTSSAPGKTRVPTALCPVCGKNISANGANFRRHQQACRRQRAGKPTPSSLATPSTTSPVVHNPSTTAAFPASEARTSVPSAWMMPPGASSSVGQPHSAAAAYVSPHHDARLAFDPFPNSAHVAASQRRDMDLIAAVQRLERSISTLDVNARLCLRDALVSLSNKASNPHILPTPEQEAMNRAAEYLVLRMLFLSGQQVMHTAPGTSGPAYAEPAMTDEGVDAGAVARRISTGSMSTAGGIAGRSNSGNDTDDGTIAASTGGAAIGGPKSENNMVVQEREQTPPPPMKVEEKLGGA